MERISHLLGLDEFNDDGSASNSLTSFLNVTSKTSTLQLPLSVKAVNQLASNQQDTSPLHVSSLSSESVSDTALANADQQHVSAAASVTFAATAVHAQTAFPSPLGGSATLFSGWDDVPVTHVPLTDTATESPRHGTVLLTSATPLMPVPTYSVSVIPSHVNVSSSKVELVSKSAVKIPSTWADASSKVNIDLDDLGMKKKPQKHSVPMNQMTSIMSVPPTNRNILAKSIVFADVPQHRVSSDDMLDLLR
ncbi:unnamed protein product [Litomosoides sigmodontis]|uniref:Uncharacterized protein n=1 Tax=Litomosoides sigmodontis TaxID=42156 RepID=A0A3P7K6S4_LITSI|nr:unnamed protein product [Litomosoides sigmodontis]